jgi:hypothetical protein
LQITLAKKPWRHVSADALLLIACGLGTISNLHVALEAWARKGGRPMAEAHPQEHPVRLLERRADGSALVRCDRGRSVGRSGRVLGRRSRLRPSGESGSRLPQSKGR